MAVLKVKDINGDWVSIPVIATGDAQTLEGHPSNYFATNTKLNLLFTDTAEFYQEYDKRVSNIETQLSNVATTLDKINGVEI